MSTSAADAARASLRGSWLPLRLRMRAPQAMLLQRLHLRLLGVSSATARSAGLGETGSTFPERFDFNNRRWISLCLEQCWTGWCSLSLDGWGATAGCWTGLRRFCRVSRHAKSQKINECHIWLFQANLILRFRTSTPSVYPQNPLNPFQGHGVNTVGWKRGTLLTGCQSVTGQHNRTHTVTPRWNLKTPMEL